MIFDAIITFAAISALFSLKKFYRISMFIWICTNGYWLGRSLTGCRWFEAAMFLGFGISCIICCTKK